MIDIDRHLVDRGPRDFAACVQRALVSSQTGKGRQQRWVDIDQTPSVMRDKTRGQNSHEARQNDQRGLPRVDGASQRGVEFFARCELPVVHDAGSDIEPGGDSQTLGLGTVADDAGNPGAETFLPVLRTRRVYDGGHVRAFAGNHNHDVLITCHRPSLGPNEADFPVPGALHAVPG